MNNNYFIKNMKKTIIKIMSTSKFLNTFKSDATLLQFELVKKAVAPSTPPSPSALAAAAAGPERPPAGAAVWHAWQAGPASGVSVGL